ncbi:UDP-N-acetylmuramoyl-L-alanine--D-glutamate ligase [Candidatus Saccharibacteria bacterium]|nr:UDP-N-acetylmuramoyl-L-alanine--D-glutamate ligase [Candidatus Saccharibacteria bacterium]
MKIALLGYGKEGKAAEKYFRGHEKDVSFDIYENETPEVMRARDYSHYDLVFRSPSVPPMKLPNETSVTKYFFSHCPCQIIGVTATKGKGTTCSFIKSLLDAHGADAYLVGNIGVPALEVLDKLTANSVVVYEMSSFQLWDMNESPHIAVLGTLEPDHLNVHRDYEDYLAAKSHITTFQTTDDYLIYYRDNDETVKIAEKTQAQKIAYPFPLEPRVMNSITLLGEHNFNNATGAIAAVSAYLGLSVGEYLEKYEDEICAGLSAFHGLPHRLELVREYNGVRYYDDNFATNVSSLKVAIAATSGAPTVIIIGGRDKTNYKDLPELYAALGRENIKAIILMGESGHELAKRYGLEDERFILTESLMEAVAAAREEAEKLASATKPASEWLPDNTPIVLMSPAAASFDMFQDVYERGEKYQEIVRNLA